MNVTNECKVQTPQTELETNWNKYAENIPGYIKSMDITLDEHSILSMSKDKNRTEKLAAGIDETQELWDTLLKIQKGLIKYGEIFYKQRCGIRLAMLFQKENLQNQVLNAIVGLSIVLNSKCEHARKLCKKYDGEKKKHYLSKSYCVLKVACNLKKENKELLTLKSYEKLDGMLQEVAAEYYTYEPSKVDDPDKILVLIAKAEKMKIKEALQKYQEALFIAKESNNFEQQYRILMTKSNIIGGQYDKRKYTKSYEDISFRQKLLRDVCEPVIEAIEVIINGQLSFPLEQHKMACLQLHNIATEIFSLSFFSYQISRRLELLGDANQYQAAADKLMKHVSLKNRKFKDLGIAIVTYMNRINENRKQESMEKEQKMLALLNAQKEYDEKFDEILKSFDEPIRVRRIKKKELETPDFYKKSSSSSSSEEIESCKPDIPKPLSYTIEIDPAFEKEIRLNMNLFELYCQRGSNLIKKGEESVDTAIAYLNKAVESLSKIVSHIHDPRNADLKDWVDRLLKEAESPLDKQLVSQTKLLEWLTRGHEGAITHIIQNHGPEGMEDFDKKSLSKNASLRIETIGRVKQLQQLQSDIQEFLSASNLKKEKLPCHAEDQKENVIKKRHILFYAKPREPVFEEGQNITRHRSVTSYSYFLNYEEKQANKWEKIDILCGMYFNYPDVKPSFMHK